MVVSFILLVLQCFWEECICCDAHNSLQVFTLMYSRKDKQEIVIIIIIFLCSPTCPHLARFLVLFPCLPLSFSSAVFPVFLQGKSAPPLSTYKGPWHLISCLCCSFTLFLCVILALLHLYPSQSPSHSFFLLLSFHCCLLINPDFTSNSCPLSIDHFAEKCPVFLHYIYRL